MQDLKITIIQSSLHWEDIDANLSMFEEKIQSISEQTDLIVLPEMFNTGFTMNAEKLHENMDGKTMTWMREIARKTNAAITGSLIIREADNFYNRLIWMQPDGIFKYYDKRHLFRLANEQKFYSAGKEKLIVELNGWKICPMICYDLRFPVWNRNADGYDLLLIAANWPEKRIYAWKQLLVARAIENESFVIGVSCVGIDGNEIQLSGASSVIDYEGKILWQAEQEQAIKTISLSKDDLVKWRRTFPFWKDADRFKIED